jgi:phospholipid/cholesterol/gamma-HCH transport system substrate-binding protein
METRANYALIGAFTLAVAFAAFLFVYWFSGPSQLGRQETFQIVFAAVSGLTRGSSVLFNGVKVGEVTHLGISEQDPSKVDVLVRIDSRTPVKTDTRASGTRGFTGVSDVLLVGGTPGAPPLTAQSRPEVSKFRLSAPKSKFAGQRSEPIDEGRRTLTKLDKLIDDNGPAITATLKNAETVSKTFADNSASITSFIRDASDVAQSMKPVAARLDKVLAAGEKTIKAIIPRSWRSPATCWASNASTVLPRQSREGEQLA